MTQNHAITKIPIWTLDGGQVVSDSQVEINQTKPPSVAFNAAPYMRYLEDSDLPDADKQALLEALWRVVSGFVELGFGVHPVQQAQAEAGAYAASCGQSETEARNTPEALLYSDDQDHKENKGGETCPIQI